MILEGWVYWGRRRQVIRNHVEMGTSRRQGPNQFSFIKRNSVEKQGKINTIFVSFNLIVL